MPFSISGLLSSLNQYQSIIVWCVCEVNFVLFNSMLKYVINRLMHVFLHIRTVIIPRPIDIDPRAKSLWPISVSRDDKSPDMEKDMH